MNVFTLSPVVQLTLIISLLLVIILVACNRQFGENMLWFLSGLFDLLFRWWAGKRRRPTLSKSSARDSMTEYRHKRRNMRQMPKQREVLLQEQVQRKKQMGSPRQ